MSEQVLHEPVAPPAAARALPDRPPRGFEAWVDRVADRLNPIVVKEIRQGLRTKVFWVCFALMLFACLVISLIAFATSRDAGFEASGPAFFVAYFVCLGLVQFFVIPYSAYRSLAREREEETWVLLTLTGLGPRRILRGKLASFLVQSALYGSAAGPFVLFSYYLNGIDLPTILIVLALGLTWQIFLTAVGVSAATLAENRLMRALVHFLLLGALVMATGMGLSAAGAMVSTGRALPRDVELRFALAGALWAMLSYGVLLFEAAAARLSLPTEGYAKGPRAAFLIQWVGSVALVAAAWVVEGFKEDIALVAQGLFSVHLVFAGIFLASDADGMAARHRPGTTAFSLFKPGALRGFRLVMLVNLVSTLLWATVFLVSDTGGGDIRKVYAILAMGGYVALYVSLPMLVSRLIPMRAFRSPAFSRVLFLAILFLASGVPPLLGAIVTGNPSEPVLNLLNPTVGTANFSESSHDAVPAVIMVSVTAAIAMIVADRLLKRADLGRSAGH